MEYKDLYIEIVEEEQKKTEEVNKKNNKENIY